MEQKCHSSTLRKVVDGRLNLFREGTFVNIIQGGSSIRALSLIRQFILCLFLRPTMPYLVEGPVPNGLK